MNRRDALTLITPTHQSGEHAEAPSLAPASREWLTAAEAAQYAGSIGIDTVRVACNLNRLQHVRIGGSVRGPIRTRREWIDEWLQQWLRGGRAA